MTRTTQFTRLSVAVVSLFGLVLGACSDPTETTFPARDDVTINDATPDTSDQGDDATVTDPLLLVPPVALVGEQSACLGDYANNSPVNGHNYDFRIVGDWTGATPEGDETQQDRDFFVLLPDAEVHEGPRPVLWVWHGTGLTGAGVTLGPGSFSPGDLPVVTSDSGYDSYQTVTVVGTDAGGSEVTQEITLGGGEDAMGATALETFTSASIDSLVSGDFDIYDEHFNKVVSGDGQLEADPAEGTFSVYSADDGDTATVTVSGVAANGDAVTETLTLDGTTTVDGAVTFAGLTDISITGTTAGEVALIDSMDTVIALLPAGASPSISAQTLSPRRGYELEIFRENGFIVIAPNNNANGILFRVWDALRPEADWGLANADLQLFDDLLSCMAFHFELDENRIYTVGQSAGGIMTNLMLQHRSDVFAGGVVASGILDLARVQPQPEIDDMAVLVTWGGSNDEFSGSTPEGDSVPSVNFAEQATIASRYWEDFDNVNQVYCTGAELGHTWLISLNEWTMDFLLAHPKGLAMNEHWTFEAPELGDIAVCGDDGAEFVQNIEVVCEATETTGCFEYCQMVGDCGVANATAAPVLGPELMALGFSGENLAMCGGCTDFCELDAAIGAAADTRVLGCLDAAFDVTDCSAGGLEGLQPFVDAINLCCDGEVESNICGRLCTQLEGNSIAAALFPNCLPWAEGEDPGPWVDPNLGNGDGDDVGGDEDSDMGSDMDDDADSDTGADASDDDDADDDVDDDASDDASDDVPSDTPTDG